MGKRRVLAWVMFGVLAACSGSSDGGPGPGAGDAGGGGLASANIAGEIDFGPAECGSTAPIDKVFSLKNSGSAPLTWSAAIGAGGPFAIVGNANGTVEPGASADITVRANPIAALTPAGTTVKGSLVLTTNDPAHASASVPLSVTAEGGTLTLKPVAVAFGLAAVGAQAPDINVTLTNTGNKEVTVAIAQPLATDFALAWTGAPGAVKVAPNASVTGLVARFKPTSNAAQDSSAALTVTGGACGQSVSSIPMKGQGTSAVVAVSPALLDFGQVACGARADVQVVTLTNSGNSPFNWTATLAKGAGSPFTLLQTGGTVGPKSTAQVIAQPAAIPQVSAVTPNLYGDTLTISTNATGDAPHQIDLQQTARGAILSISPSPIPFAKQEVFTSSAPLPVKITNTGNTAATVTLSIGGDFAVAPLAATPVAAGGALDATVTFSPSNVGSKSASLAVTTSSGLCSPPLSAVPASGTGAFVASQVAAGTGHACAIVTGGRVACWGRNREGQLGLGQATNTLAEPPSIVTGLTGATKLASGMRTTCAISGGTVKCWGDGASGRLGNGSGASSNVPIVPNGLAGVTAATMVMGHSHAWMLDAGGAVYAWGRNRWGQFGVGTMVDGLTPAVIPGLGTVAELGPGGSHMCIRTGATVSCAGRNTWGELGDGMGDGGLGITSTTFVPVTGITDAVSVTSGSRHSCAIRGAGTVSCWGRGDSGELGNGATTTMVNPAPVNVSNITNATQLVAGNAYTCALLATNRVSCWGTGGNGRLGNGTNTTSAIPVQVSNITTATAIAGGHDFACALLQGGSVSCWGFNSYGQLGNVTYADSNVPVTVAGF